MRGFSLVLSTLLAAFGGTLARAQVYSSNVVGYVNVTIDATDRPTGAFAMITNPLDQGVGNYAVSSLIPAPPEGTWLFKFLPERAYEPANVFEFGEWGMPGQTIEPGQGVFIRVPGGQSLTITFVGEVRQAAASNKALVVGFNMTGSLVPQAGALSAVLEYPAGEGDLVYRFNKTTQLYDQVYVFEFGDWGGREPSLDVGEAVFIKPAAARQWNRDFSVN